jgi:hypothetical protein
VGVKLTKHVAAAPLPDSVQVVVLNTPADPVFAKLTVPLGVIAIPLELSVTVAVQVDAWFTTTDAGAQLRVAVVILLLTVTIVLPLEVA